MPFINTDETQPREIIKGARAKFVHTDGMTMSIWNFDEGAVLPAHSHFHEQMTKLISGKFEMTLDGETKVFTESDIAVIPPNVVHSGRAITACVMVDVFHPVREDYK